ncbi:MAG: GntR family transcriptional regulator [Silicimonas sp.]|jgi:GntR family transcriptional regulator|nr:GntR family transcriptional regulator [Silicimonas sp.]
MRSEANALPKYIQASETLIRDIVAGRLRDGERLAPERDMAADMGIAVGTLRKALGELEQRGLIERIQGSGNYIRHQPDTSGVYALFRLERIDGGGLPSADLYEVSKVEKPADLPRFGSSTMAHRIRRLRRLSAEPIALEEIWLDAKWADTIDPKRLSESLYLFYRRSLNLWITRAEDRIGIAPMPDWGRSLGVFRDGMAGFVERFGETDTGEVAEYSRTWFNSDRARYVSRIR